jgi:hypothetical protein
MTSAMRSAAGQESRLVPAPNKAGPWDSAQSAVEVVVVVQASDLIAASALSSFIDGCPHVVPPQLLSVIRDQGPCDL